MAPVNGFNLYQGNFKDLTKEDLFPWLIQKAKRGHNVVQFYRIKRDTLPKKRAELTGPFVLTCLGIIQIQTAATKAKIITETKKMKVAEEKTKEKKIFFCDISLVVLLR